MSNVSNPDYFIDITGEVCPMTFVKTKLRIERMSPGEVLEIRLQGHEPLTNVPRSLKELGHEILLFLPESSDSPDGIHRLVVKKA
ncbi:MAG: sulfurtransferase TusA family protein [Rhodospirillales bacterium]|jgi:TusA-related sulfurtransferase|nr:sulfurtransferase TusA family protein [Rhodospirillales bacterium]